MEPDTDPIMGAAPVAINAAWDGVGFRRRMGLAVYSGAPSTTFASNAISGLYLAANGTLLAVDSTSPQRQIYRLVTGAATNISDTSSTGGLRGTSRPVFAETEAIVAIAGGEEPLKIRLDTGACSLLGGSPPQSTFIVANNSRLLCNNMSVRNRINYSAQAAGSSYSGHEDWSSASAGYVASDARADYVVALGENANEVYAFGRKTTQVFAADSVITYASVTARDYGCSAPSTVLRIENGFAWLDHKRRVVVSDGRSFQVVSGPIQSELDDMATVSDAYGFEPYDGILCWRFTDGRTFAYDTERQTWSLWMGWDNGANNFQDWKVTAALIRDDTGECLVGTRAGAVRELTYGAADDYGQRIVMELKTGFLNRGTSARKWCKKVRFIFRRGDSSTDSNLSISWRDGLGAWGPERPVALAGGGGDRSVVVEMSGLGVYRMRQWRLRYSGPDDLVFAGAVEDFDVSEV